MADGGRTRVDAQSMLDSMILAGKTTVRSVGREQIRAFIEAQPGVLGGVEVTIIGATGDLGASNGCILFNAGWQTEGGTVWQDLVLRHAPGTDQRLFADYDLARQFHVQRALRASAAPVPQPFWLDPDGVWLGLPGYAMERVEGVAPSAAAYVSGPLAEASEPDRDYMLDEVMRALVAIHQTDLAATGLTQHLMDAPGSSPIERLVNWYWKNWTWLKVPEYERLRPARDWLLANVPAGEPELIHGDAALHNYLFSGRNLAAVVDWEMSTLARAEADLAMQCMINRVFAPPAGDQFPQPPTEDEWLQRYRKAGGRPLRDLEYFKVVAAMMIVFGVVGLQRNSSAHERSGQDALLEPCWRLVDRCRL